MLHFDLCHTVRVSHCAIAIIGYPLLLMRPWLQLPLLYNNCDCNDDADCKQLWYVSQCTQCFCWCEWRIMMTPGEKQTGYFHPKCQHFYLFLETEVFYMPRKSDLENARSAENCFVWTIKTYWKHIFFFCLPCSSTIICKVTK